MFPPTVCEGEDGNRIETFATFSMAAVEIWAGRC